MSRPLYSQGLQARRFRAGLATESQLVSTQPKRRYRLDVDRPNNPIAIVVLFAILTSFAWAPFLVPAMVEGWF